MTTMADDFRKERPWLFLPRAPCGFCRLRPSVVQDLCSLCAEDDESREQYAAQQAKLEQEDDT